MSPTLPLQLVPTAMRRGRAWFFDTVESHVRALVADAPWPLLLASGAGLVLIKLLEIVGRPRPSTAGGARLDQ